MYECKCGKTLKNKSGAISHLKACIGDIIVDAVGAWEVVRKGVQRIVIRW